MSSIRTRAHNPITASSRHEDSSSTIERLQKTIEQLRKQLRSLYERLENAGDRSERMAIQHTISGVEDMIEAIRRQIMMVTQLENRHQAAGPAQTRMDSRTSDPDERGRDPDSANQLYKPPYELGQ